MRSLLHALNTAAIALGLMAASAAQASTTRVDFELGCTGCDVSMQPVPVIGSFTYASTETGVLGLSNLHSFDIAFVVTDTSVPSGVSPTQSRSFSLSEIVGIANAVALNPTHGYFHFAWDATNQEFVEGYAGPGWSNDASNVLHLLAAAIDTPAYSGFKIDRTPPLGSSQTVTLFNTDPGDQPTGRSFIQQYNDWVVSVEVTAVPEPSAVLLALAGLGVLLGVGRHRQRASSAATAAA